MMKRRNQHKKGSNTPSISNCFIIGIDGSAGSHNAFELVLNDLHRKGLDKIILVHVFSEKDEEAGIQFHNKTIYNKYSEELKSKLHEDDYEIIFEERKPNENVFEQINDIAVSKKASLMVLGFRGKNGAKSRPDELSNAITYLVHKPRIPVLVVKDIIVRSEKTDSTYNWLVCLESTESKSFKALESMCRFVDADNDTFTAITVKSQKSNGENEISIQRKFEEKMNEYEIKKFSYKILEKEGDDKVHRTIVKFVLDCQKNTDLAFDFVVCGYNPLKYSLDKDASNTTVDILKYSDVNIFFDH